MTTIALAKIIGVYSLIMAVAMITRRKMHLKIFHELFSHRAYIYIIGVAELVAGLIIVFGDVFFGRAAEVITIFGWLAIVEGVFYVFVPGKTVRRVGKMLDGKVGYYSAVLIYLALGLYLTYVGFFVGV